MNRKLYISLLFLMIFALAANADTKKKNAAPLSSAITVTILRDTNGKPIRNASVILHSVSDEGQQDKGGLQLKTNQDGVATIGGIPYGKLRIQVIGPGLQTFGEDFEINEPRHSFTIRMKPPSDQYSIYK